MKQLYTLKKLSLLVLGCICATNAMAQTEGSGLYRIADERAANLEDGKTYVIYNTAKPSSTDNRTGFIYANSTNGLGLNKKQPVNKEILPASHVWTVEAGSEEGKYHLKSKSLDKYVSSTGSTNTTEAADIIIEKWTEHETAADKSGVASENHDGTTTTASASISETNHLWIIGQGAGNDNSSWWNGDATRFATWSTAHPFAFYEVEELDNEDLVQVTYTYTMGGNTLGSETVAEYTGCAPTKKSDLPAYLNVTGFPATITADNTTYTINTEYNASMPFRVSTDGAPVYYRIKFNQGNGYYWYANASNQGKEEYETCTGLTLATEQNWKWKMVGDWFNGFNIVTQSGKYLTAGTPASGSNTTHGNFKQGTTSLADTPDDSNSYFLLQRFSSNQAWRFNLKGSDLNLAHTSHSSLVIGTFWGQNTPDYAGAKLIFEEMGDFQTIVNEAPNEAKGYLAMTHVGTPVDDATERTELQAKVTEVERLDANSISYQEYKTMCDSLTAKLTAYFTCTNVRMLESGKAYTIVFRPTDAANGTYRYLNFTGTGLQTVAMTDKNSEIPESGVFVVRSWTDGSTTKYAMVPAYGNVHGKYLTYQTVTGTWTEGVNEFTADILNNASTDNNTFTDADTSAKNRFGYMYFLFTNRSASSSLLGVYIINDTTGNFDNATAPFLHTTRHLTSALIVKEVENYPSTVQLREAANIDGISAIGTFSAPYAAIVPEGVTAHYVSTVGNNAYVTTTAIAEGEAIPAGQGVLLTGEAGTAVMQPATTETVATIESNLLGNTAGAAKALTAGSDYILTSGTLANGNNGVAFYPISSSDLTVSANKAYLHTEGANAPALALSFGDGDADGVKDIDGTKGGQAPVFDLQGRRVQKAVKGLYIQNGKKFMVK